MPEFIIYLAKVNAALILFYMGYYLLLRKLTFYTLNRAYFLFGLLFSIFYPFLGIHRLFSSTTYLQSSTVAINWSELAADQSSGTGIWDWIAYAFWVIVFLFVIRFIIRLFSLWMIRRQSVPDRYAHYHYRKVLLPIDPFSFWKSIYVNPILYTHNKLNDIFKHEQVHIDELHTADILIAELVCLFCWFNPFIWLMRRAIEENLEFITDRKVLRSGVDKQAYQYSLVQVMTQNSSPTLGAHFNFRTLKKRIVMMNKRQSSNLNLGKYLFILPMMMLLATVFTISKAYEPPKSKTKIASTPITTTAGSPLAKEKATKNEQTAIASLDTTPKAKVRIEVKNKDGKKGDLTKTKKKPLIIVDGLRYDENINNLDPESIERIDILKDEPATSLYGEKGKNGVVLITTKVRDESISDQKETEKRALEKK